MKIPSDLKHLFYLLDSPVHMTFLVGGCVRDYILGKEPKDFDVVSNISMDKITELLEKEGWKVDETGKQFLVLTITSPKGNSYEIANFRSDKYNKIPRKVRKIKK